MKKRNLTPVNKFSHTSMILWYSSDQTNNCWIICKFNTENMRRGVFQSCWWNIETFVRLMRCRNVFTKYANISSTYSLVCIQLTSLFDSTISETVSCASQKITERHYIHHRKKYQRPYLVTMTSVSNNYKETSHNYGWLSLVQTRNRLQGQVVWLCLHGKENATYIFMNHAAR